MAEQRNNPPPAAPADAILSLPDLVADIENAHHAYARRELPKLTALIARVARKHGARQPKLLKLEQVFDDFAKHLLEHMLDEERLIFPACRAVAAPGAPEAQADLGSIRAVDKLIHDHDDSGMSLQTFYELTDGYELPPELADDADYRSMLEGLKALERDMRQHVYKENCLLFPRVIASANAQAKQTKVESKSVEGAVAGSTLRNKNARR
jgi:regulator of cell morphogenesis and NO signaling